MQNREYLKKGDLRLLYGVWQKYSYEDEEDEEDNEDAPPATPGMDKLPKPISELLSLLTHN
jgi:hypothetical protein